MDNMRIWDAVKRPPPEALKKITGGRLSGMTDIKPQWRYQAMTELFGPCGVGWKFEIEELTKELVSDDQILAFAKVLVFIKDGDNWSAPIPGMGGSMMVTKESKGLHSSDECFKMAVTDALSTALKILGVGSDIYMGMWDGTKYTISEDELRLEDMKKAVGMYGKEISSIKESIANDDWAEAAKTWFTVIPESAKKSLWVAPTKGGPFTVEEREIMKLAEFRKAHFGEDK